MNEIKITEVNNGFIISTSNETHVATKDNPKEFANILKRLSGYIGASSPIEKPKETKKILPGIYIVHPETAELFTFEEWKKQEDPTTALLVAIVTKDACLYVSKNTVGKQKFEEAQAVASEYHHSGVKSLFRCPTRKEAFDIYDARCKELNDAIRLIGGDTFGDYWYWTSGESPDPEFSSDYAFAYNGFSGDVSSWNKYYKYRVRPVSSL